MFREFLSIFKSDDPLSTLGEHFTEMLSITASMTQQAGAMYFAGSASSGERGAMYEEDIRVNKLERLIRKRVIAHLSIRRHTSDLPYCLLLLSLVKDVERLGDYAKNLAEVMDFRPGPLPDDVLRAELDGIRSVIEGMFAEAAEVVALSKTERALALIQQGRTATKTCDALILKIAGSAHDASTASALVLGTRYYKRIGGHLLNVLSSVVMPLHKLDYFDEDEVLRTDA